MTVQTKRTSLACVLLCFRLCVYKAYADNVPQIIVNDWTRCDDSENTFVTLWDLSVQECLLECDKRKQCKALNFMRHGKKCELLETDLLEKIDVEKQWCIHIRKTDNIGIYPVPNQCARCPAGLVCDLSTGSCLHKECGKPSVSNGAMVGNMKSVGSTFMTIPETGYSLGEQSPQSVCMSNGIWDNIPVPQIVDCDQPPALPHALITGTGTVYDTTRSYECECGCAMTDSSTSTSVTCGPDGEWSQPEFECTVSDQTLYTEWQSMAETGISYRAIRCAKNYWDAADYCVGLGRNAHLAYVKTEQEYDTVKEYLETFETNLFHSWWIGIRWGTTGWVYTGTQTPIDFTAWSTNQGSGYTGHCVELTFKLGGKWNDAIYSKFKWPICEIRDGP